MHYQVNLPYTDGTSAMTTGGMVCVVLRRFSRLIAGLRPVPGIGVFCC